MPPRRLALALAAAALLVVPATPPASAEVRFEGDARMGILRSSDLEEDRERWSFTSRLRLTLKVEAETDGGLTFGGRFRLDHAEPRAGTPPRTERN